MGGLVETGRSALRSALERVGRGWGRIQERRPLSYDLLESDGAYLVVFDAPGAEREDVQVRYDGAEVGVRVDRFREFQDGFEMRVPGRGLSLSGEVTLPVGADVDVDAAEATLTENGTVRVRVPKRTDEHAEGADEAADDTGGAEE